MFGPAGMLRSDFYSGRQVAASTTIAHPYATQPSGARTTSRRARTSGAAPVRPVGPTRPGPTWRGSPALLSAGVLLRPALGELTTSGKIVGRPRPLRAWWYANVFGNQESVNLLFDYAHREHCLSVLIEHPLGGG